MALSTFNLACRQLSSLRNSINATFIKQCYTSGSRSGVVRAHHGTSASKARPAAPQGMGELAEWEAALNQKSHDNHDDHGTTDAHVLVTPTPHPAAASAAECSEWEAVLLAAETAAAHKQHTVGPQTSQQPLYAVVECGSHSTRLLLSMGSSDVERLTMDTHLGRNIGTSTTLQQQQQQPVVPVSQGPVQLQPDVFAATLDALKHYRTVIDKYNITAITAVATAAVREAANADAFQAAASNILGCQLQILSGADEGCAAFLGATASLAASGCCCLVFDMGGRSTEFAVGTAGHAPEAVCSIPLGCLSVAANSGEGPAAAVACQHNRQEQPAEPQQLLHSAQQIISDHAELLQSVQMAFQVQCTDQSLLPNHKQPPISASSSSLSAAAAAAASPAGPPVVLGAGGTITTIAALLQQLPEYSHDAVHMSTLRERDVQQLMQDLHTQHNKLRMLAQHPWLTGERAASLQPGCAGILAIMHHLQVHDVLVSDADLLAGIVQSLATKEDEHGTHYQG